MCFCRQAINELFAFTKGQVEVRIAAAACIHIQVDYWEDNHRAPMLGISVRTDTGDKFLRKMDRENEHEYGEVVAQRIGEQVAYLKTINARPVSVISDNAANMQNACALASQRDFIVASGCLAHWVNLILKDITSLYSVLLSKCNAVVDFFSNCHYPRTVLFTAKERHPGSQVPVRRCATR